MNYRHAFHAGNHGDVLKHAVLARVLGYLTAKDKPMAVLDAHSGIGTYDLSGVEAFKTGEWRDGIAKLLAADLAEDVKLLLDPYLSLVKAMNGGGHLRHYPGSPEIAARLLRPIDRLLLNELHPDDRQTLSTRYNADPRVRVSGVDAAQAIKAELPFSEKRGLVLIDPAFEVVDETERVARMVQNGLRRMQACCFLIWYPVTTREFANALCKAVAGLDVPELLQAELMVRAPGPRAGLAGSGVLVINPPWTLHDELRLMLPALASVLGVGSWGRGTVAWLTPPK